MRHIDSHFLFNAQKFFPFLHLTLESKNQIRINVKWKAGTNLVFYSWKKDTSFLLY